MRRIVLVLAVIVFLAALILDTTAVLRIVAIYGWLLVRTHPWWVAAAVGLAVAASLWPRRPWRRRPHRRGKRRSGRSGRPARKRPAAGASSKQGQVAAAAPPDAAAKPRVRKPRKPRRPAG